MFDTLWLWVGFNVFVLLMLALDPGVLFRGIPGALIMRATMFALAANLITEFAWITFVFGASLTFVGIEMLLSHSPGKIDTHLSLDVIVTVFAASVVASLVWPKKAAGAIAEFLGEGENGVQI
jgi:hypothetical protein